MQNILKATENQILHSRKETPNMPFGLVTFNNQVKVFGDGMNQSEQYSIES